MLEIIEWLRKIEQLAHNLYAGAAQLFAWDDEFSTFLRRLAEDETWHLNLMDSAAAYLVEQDVAVSSAVVLDEATRERVEAPLERALGLVGEGTVTKAQMIALLVAVEFCELNDLFMYVVDMLKAYSTVFQHGAAVIQSHRDRISQFVTALPDALKPADDVGGLPTVWERRYLVVDDSPPVRDLLRRYLGRAATVETAASGPEGLERLHDRYFDAIIADVEMPGMDGIAFYRWAIAQDPQIGQRFLFCSGLLSREREAFFRENALLYVPKPFRLADIGHTIQTIVERTERAAYDSNV